MIHGKKWANVWAAVALACLLARPLAALEPADVLAFSFGKLTLRPQVEIRERYDSNLFYAPENETSDFITDVMAGLNMFFGDRELNFLSLGYLFDQAFYVDNDFLNSGNHMLNFGLQLKGNRWSLKGTDSIQFLSSVLSGYLNVDNKPVERFSFLDSYTLAYAISEKMGVYLTGAFDALDYESGTPLYDYNTLTGTAGFEFKAFPKTSLFSELYYGQSATSLNPPFGPGNISTNHQPHSEFVGGFVGGKGNFTPRLTGQVKLGYEGRQFSDGSSQGSGMVAMANMTYQFSEKTTFSLTYNRHPYVSMQYGNIVYVADTVRFEVRQAIGTRGKWMARANLGYEQDKYESLANRTDSLYTVSAGLDYLIQLWLSAGLTYEFITFDTNAGQFSVYDVHRIGLRLAIGY